MTDKIQKFLKKVAALVLVIALILPACGSLFSYALGAGSYNSIGTNKALGSPILNSSFSADDWNKWEMVVWGIFLSNFTTPFIDDYNSAFNLNAGYGSKGSGAKALQFGSGNDVANSKQIQDLLDFAINQQSVGGTKQIYVSYNKIDDFKISEYSKFTGGTVDTPVTTPDTTEDTGTEEEPGSGAIEDPDDVDVGTGNMDAITSSGIRVATLKDLIFESTEVEGTTWAPFNNTADFNMFLKNVVEATDYTSILGIEKASVPTFAVDAVGGNHEVVLDYTNSYDLGLMPLIASRGAAGDFADEFGDELDKVFENPDNYKLVLDCFGNICTKIDSKMIVIIPAAANRCLTNNPSINMANSLVFNSCTKTTSTEQLILNGGQKIGNWFASLFVGSDKLRGGIPALSNKASGLNSGQAVVYFDTDTIVVQDAINAGHNLGSWVDHFDENIADVFIKLYGLDINDSNKQQYPFKLESANLDESIFDVCASDKGKKALKSMSIVSNQLVNQVSKPVTAKVLTKLKTDVDDLDIFSSPVTIPVTVAEGSNSGSKKYYSEAGIRFLSNWVFQRYQRDISTSAGDVKASSVQEAFNRARQEGTALGLTKHLFFDPDTGNLSPLMKGYLANRTDFYKITDMNKLNNYTENMSTYQMFDYLNLIEGSKEDEAGFKLSDNTEAKRSWWEHMAHIGGGADLDAAYDLANYEEWIKHNPFGRTIKMYTTSDVMLSIANILGVREGTEFAVYSMYIYLTYLDWYGVTGASLSSLSGDDNTSNLNTRIFDGNSDILVTDITSITTVVTEEEKEKQILDWTYMMLNPTEGRAYRSNMIITGISDWIYDNYQKIVYGNASSYYDTGTGVTSRNSTGFLTVAPYSENFMTAWFVNNYAYFSVILIGIFLILTIVIGLLKKRKLSWFLISILAMVNMVLILPATGEVVPLVSNNFVQGMFSDKMSYWAISEGVTNATMESDYVKGKAISGSYIGQLSKNEQSQVINLVKNLNTLYIDRSLAVKQDISKKVTQTATSTFEDVQQLRSARWMLPMIMRQFTASDGSANYVYVPLGDLYDDLSNMYWYYKPEDAAFVSTVNAKQKTSNETGAALPSYATSSSTGSAGPITASNRTAFFKPYKDLTVGYVPEDMGHKQSSYEINPTNNVHTYSYFIDETGLIGGNMPRYADFESYDDWARTYAEQLKIFSLSDLTTVERNMEMVGGKYSRFDRGTIRGVYGFMWATENPFHYFYDGIKDSLKMDGSLGALAGELQGTYVTDEETGIEVRKSFMHANNTGYIKDVLDLEEMFTNMIPYLYSMQLLAEGYDDVEGVFPDGELIELYKAYEKNNKSWLFRSNWVTKLMENREYRDSATIGLPDGTKTKVANMMLEQCYVDAGRPMVFSEAQMHSLGLKETDLSLIELKCIKTNKDVSKKWTLLINYVSVPGMTKEVMVRQMALDALLAFNSEFTPVGIVSGAYTMYPSGIDLRAISFDSVMKMLMLNVTHDTSYIYGDTMQTLVEDSDIFTSFLLLATAFICAFLIPLARNFVLGLIFFLGLWALLWAIFRSTKNKAKISCGFIVSNVIFLCMTLVYYLAFKSIIVMTSSDEVLSLTQIEINTGNPVWCLIFVLAISLLYCAGIYKMVVFCVRNYRDMGFEVYAGIAEMAAGSVSAKIEGAGAKITGSDEVEGSGGKRGSTSRGRRKDPVEVTTVSGGTGSGSGASSGTVGSGIEGNRDFDEYDASAYTDGRDNDMTSDGSDIDREIQRGREMSSGQDSEE